MQRFMLKYRILIFILVAGFFATACSKDDDKPRRNTYRVTITLENVEAIDIAIFTLGGGNYDGSDGNTLWRVNGQTRTGETHIGFGDTDFMNGTTTYVIESINPLDLLVAGLNLSNNNGEMPYSLVIEKNGNTELNESGTLADGESFNRNYNF